MSGGTQAPSSQLRQPVSLRLGDLLVTEGLITEQQLQQALQVQKGSNEKLGAILIRLGVLQEERLIDLLARQRHMRSLARWQRAAFSTAVTVLVIGVAMLLLTIRPAAPPGYLRTVVVTFVVGIGILFGITVLWYWVLRLAGK